MGTIQTKERDVRYAVSLFAYLLITWGFYRLLFQAPEVIEEFLVKPVVWLMPTFYLLKKEKADIDSIGITTKGLFTVIYLTLALGAVFAIEGLLVNYLKYGGFEFAANIGSSFSLALLLSFATAIPEEIAFRGYIFTRLWRASGSEWNANLLTAIMWSAIHAPIAIFDWRFDAISLLGFLLMVFMFSVGASYMFARTKNIASSIFLHVLWQWPIILFR